MSFLYILSNNKLPDVCKVGMTAVSPQARADEISRGTGVYGKWSVHASYTVPDARKWESMAHKHLAEHRDTESGGNELFNLSPDEADVRLNQSKALDLRNAEANHLREVVKQLTTERDTSLKDKEAYRNKAIEYREKYNEVKEAKTVVEYRYTEIPQTFRERVSKGADFLQNAFLAMLVAAIPTLLIGAFILSKIS
jgi:hypothetical protein